MDTPAVGTIDYVVSQIVAMATEIGAEGMKMIGQILPALVPIIAAVILVGLGYSFVRRFTA